MSSSTPPRRCRRLNWYRILQGYLALLILLNLIILVLLLTSCATPCHPSINPDRINRLIPIPTRASAALDLGIGIECEWRY